MDVDEFNRMQDEEYRRDNSVGKLAHFLGNMKNFGGPVTTYLDFGWPVGKPEPPNYEEMMSRTRKGLQGPSIPGRTDQTFYDLGNRTATDVLADIIYNEYRKGLYEHLQNETDYYYNRNKKGNMEYSA